MQTDVAHYDGLTWWGPVSDAQVNAALDLLALPAGARALDMGCGRGELLALLAERGCKAVGVDCSAAALAQARARLAERAPDGCVDLVEMRAGDYEAEPGSFQFIANLGGPFSGHTYAETLETYARWLAPGGWLLSGHGFWMQEPCAEYLEATGIPAEEFTDHAGSIRVAQEAGFDLEHDSISTSAAWETFEGTIMRNREAYSAAHPADEEARLALEKARRWTEARDRWGRATLGFALYLYRLRS